MPDVISIEGRYFQAVAAGDIDALSAIIEERPDLLSERDENGLSAVLHACYNGQDKAVQWIIERGAPLNIHEAAAVGDSDRIADVLAASPDDLNVYSADGWTPLHLAAFFNHPDAVTLLAGCSADLHLPSKSPFARGNTPLHAAVAHGSLEAVGMLIAQGADVNRRQLGNDLRPLHIAAYQARPDATVALLAAGADVSAIDDKGRTPAALAQELGNVETLAVLAKADLSSNSPFRR